jgi:hypothetical protein
LVALFVGVGFALMGFAVAYLDGVAELLSGVVFGGDDQPPRT